MTVSKGSSGVHPSRPAALPEHQDDGLSADVADDPRVVAVVQEYLKRLESGEKPDRAAYVQRYPELAVALNACLDGLELVHRALGESRPGSRSPLESRESLLPDPLGDFRIVRELGRGGMGVVYEAVQLSLGRRVALKVLPFAGTLQPRQLQRFLNEAQAAAHLHHANIVPVFAVGCDRGVHYYAMQLIDGLSLADVLGRLRTDAGVPEEDGSGVPTIDDSSAGSQRVLSAVSQPHSSSPSAPQRAVAETVNQLSASFSTFRPRAPSDYYRTVARWIQQAASGLAYAHDLGIVHRDVKPANLMLDVRGNVWVTDFGLAQFRSGADLTQTGDLVGTARYMSPEQTRGNRDLIDHRTDVYSLGATLYELVTLRPIFSAPTRDGLLYQVAQIEPRAPRAINRMIPPELETIVLKAVSKSPQDRYASAQELADDLQRFLNDEPIRARRPSMLDRMRKWSRRHPGFVITAIGLLILLTSGLLVHNRMIAGEQRKTAEALQREKDRALEAEQRFSQARQAVDILIQISEEDMADQPRLQATRQRLLETAVAYYQDFIEQRRGDVVSQQELESVQDRVRQMLRELAVLRGYFQSVLVAQQSVQSDLGLSDEQRRLLAEKLDQLSRERSQMIAESQDSTLASRKRRFLELAESSQEALANVLTVEQRQRLRQIGLQALGIAAFREPEVLRTLELTADQRAAIREIEYRGFGNFGHERRGRRGPDGPPGGDFGRRSREALQRATEVLTAEQQARWGTLLGRPFEGSISFFNPDGASGRSGSGGSREGGGREGGPSRGERSERP